MGVGFDSAVESWGEGEGEGGAQLKTGTARSWRGGIRAGVGIRAGGSIAAERD